MKIPTVLVLTALLGTCSAPDARADQPGSDWMPVERVREKLLASGYTSVTKIEADDGHWDGEGIKDGKRTKFELDPMTGDILGEATD